MCMTVLPPFKYVFPVHGPMSPKVRTGYQHSSGTELQLLQVVIYVLGIRPGPSGRMTEQPTLLPSLLFLFLGGFVCFLN